MVRCALSSTRVTAKRQPRSYNCLLVENNDRTISGHYDPVLSPLYKRVNSNLCSDCRQDELELQLMLKSVQTVLGQDDC